MRAVLVVIACCLTTTAHAEVRGMLRLGAEPLALSPTNDTPLIGGYLDDAVTGYNVASAMYNQAHGYAAGSPKASASIDRSAFALNTTLLTFAPALELGTEHVALRI